MGRLQTFWRSRPVQIGLGAIGVIALIVSAIFLVRLFNPTAEAPAASFGGVFTGTTEGDTGEIDEESFPSEWLASVGDIVYAANGDAYFTNQDLNQIFILREGKAEPFAGTGEAGYRDGPKEQAKFTSPTALALDNSGNLYVTDRGNHRVRVVNIASGTVITLAGAGEAEWAPGAFLDGSRDTARFNNPNGIAIAPSGNVYVADTGNNAIRLITADSVLTVGGQPEPGYADGDRSDALFNEPRGMDFLNSTTLLIADSGNNRIRALDIETGETSTYAGNGRNAIIDGPKLNAAFQNPTDVEVAANRSVFVTDMLNHVIRVIALDERAYTLAGTGVAGFKDGPLSQAQFNYPTAIAESTQGALLVVDMGNKTVRQLR